MTQGEASIILCNSSQDAVVAEGSICFDSGWIINRIVPNAVRTGRSRACDIALPKVHEGERKFKPSPKNTGAEMLRSKKNP